MTDPTKRFSDRVEDYVRYRPGYPKEIIDLLNKKIQFNTNWIIADIGSGTGISTELFLKNGNIVYAVEPNAEMRGAAEENLKKYEKYVSVDGKSDETTLSGNSIDMIIVCQAFHWFDPDKTKIEFRRILKTGGYTALIWNERRFNESPFLYDYEQLLRKYLDDYKNIENKNINRNNIAEFFGTEDYRLETLYNYQVLDFTGLRGRLMSASYAPKYGEKSENMVKELKIIYDKHQKENKVLFEYDTKIFYSQMK
jgi:ubiquinone/menaquinone biosynthesis C-methylase UbiE